MANILESLLVKYKPSTVFEYENALKEIIQEIALAGLSRALFFDSAAFYGGTALRLFYGLPRFSEDLDFTLLRAQEDFSLQPYFTSIVKNLESFGFSVEIGEIQKTVETHVESAFLKANTQLHLLKIQTASALASRIPPNKIMHIKVEVDIMPAQGFSTEVRPLLPPLSASVKVLQPASLFAGKIHAVLFRQWKKRVKGRDYYDFLWYLGQKIPVQIEYLRQKMIEGSQWSAEAPLTQQDLLTLLAHRFQEIDWSAAKNDVMRFIENPDEVDCWSEEFFTQSLKMLRVV